MLKRKLSRSVPNLSRQLRTPRHRLVNRSEAVALILTDVDEWATDLTQTSPASHEQHDDGNMHPASMLGFMTTPHEDTQIGGDPVAAVLWLSARRDLEPLLDLIEARA